MTVWKAGMKCACIYGGKAWESACGTLQQAGPEIGDILTVTSTRKRAVNVRTFWARHFGEKTVFLTFSTWGTHGFNSKSFRPIDDVSDDADLIARIKKCKPAPAQPHEAELQVPVRDQTLSSITDGFAAARGATVSNAMLGADLQRTTRSHEAGPDPVQNATGSVSNSNEIVVPHAEPSNG